MDPNYGSLPSMAGSINSQTSENPLDKTYSYPMPWDGHSYKAVVTHPLSLPDRPHSPCCPPPCPRSMVLPIRRKMMGWTARILTRLQPYSLRHIPSAFFQSPSTETPSEEQSLARHCLRDHRALDLVSLCPPAAWPTASPMLPPAQKPAASHPPSPCALGDFHFCFLSGLHSKPQAGRNNMKRKVDGREGYLGEDGDVPIHYPPWLYTRTGLALRSLVSELPITLQFAPEKGFWGAARGMSPQYSVKKSSLAQNQHEGAVVAHTAISLSSVIQDAQLRQISWEKGP